MRKMIVFGLMICVASAWAFSGYIYRYRLTLSVEADGNIYVGSSVIQVEVSRGININGGGTITKSKVTGDVVVVNIGKRGMLFALLSGRNGSAADTIIYKIFPISGNILGNAAIDRYPGLRISAEVPKDDLPMLVRFRNINDPTTIEQVFVNNIARDFGGGAKLVRSTIDIVSPGVWPFNKFGVTGIPITTGIQGLFPPWFVEIKRRQASLDGDDGLLRHIDAPLANQVFVSNFSRKD